MLILVQLITPFHLPLSCDNTSWNKDYEAQIRLSGKDKEKMWRQTRIEMRVSKEASGRSHVKVFSFLTTRKGTPSSKRMEKEEEKIASVLML